MTDFHVINCGASSSEAVPEVVADQRTLAAWIREQLAYPREVRRTASATTASTAVSLNNGDKATFIKLTIASNTTITFVDLPTFTDGQVFTFTLMTVNDGTAGRAVAFGNTVKWAGGILPPRTTAANAIDIWTFFIENGLIHGSLSISDAK